MYDDARIGEQSCGGVTKKVLSLGVFQCYTRLVEVLMAEDGDHKDRM
jgi:hypothetical protein